MTCMFLTNRLSTDDMCNVQSGEFRMVKLLNSMFVAFDIIIKWGRPWLLHGNCGKSRAHFQKGWPLASMVPPPFSVTLCTCQPNTKAWCMSRHALVPGTQSLPCPNCGQTCSAMTSGQGSVLSLVLPNTIAPESMRTIVLDVMLNGAVKYVPGGKYNTPPFCKRSACVAARTEVVST